MTRARAGSRRRPVWQGPLQSTSRVVARQIRRSIASYAEDSPHIIAKAASSGRAIREEDPALVEEVRLELVRAVLRAPAGSAVFVLDAFDHHCPRWWDFDSEGTGPSAAAREAWKVATRAAAVTDPDKLERLREEVRALLAPYPEHLAWSVEQVDQVARATPRAA